MLLQKFLQQEGLYPYEHFYKRVFYYGSDGSEVSEIVKSFLLSDTEEFDETIQADNYLAIKLLKEPVKVKIK